MSKAKDIARLNDEAWECQEMDKSKAKELAEKALQLAQKYSKQNEIVLAHLTLAQVANFSMQLDEAQEHLELAAFGIRKTTPRKTVARYHHQRCYNLYQRSRFHELIEAGHQMLEFINNDGFENHQAWAYSTMGMAYQRLGNGNLALESYRNAEKLFQRFDDPGAVSNIQMSIGTALAELGKKSEALLIFQESMTSRLSVGGDFHCGLILANMAKLRSQLGEHQKASRHWKDAIAYLKKAGGMPLWAQAIGGFADTLCQMNRLAEAEDQLRIALNESDKLPPPILIELHLSHSRVHADAKRWDESIESLKAAQNLMDDKTTGLTQWVDLHKAYHFAYRSKGDMESALQHHEQMLDYKEKHLNDQSVTKLAEWEALYQMERLREKDEKLSRKTAELEELLKTTSNERTVLLTKLASYDVLLDEMLDRMPLKEKGRFSQLVRAARKSNIEQDSDQIIQNRISQKHPELSPSELRMCSMIVSGWTCKEMSDRSGTSIKTVEKHRMAIRRKAAIPRSVSLEVYLKGIAKTA